MSAFTVTVKAGIKKEKRNRPEKEMLKPPSRIARQLALAYLVERLIEQGKIKNYAEAARRLGVTRARMTQVMNLINLPPDVQEKILLGHEPLSERRLRKIASEAVNGESSSTPLFTAAAAR